jgi:DNA repair exonuclease SbcCD nuclease subunit
MNKTALITDLHFGCHGNSEQWHKIMLDFAKWLAKKLVDTNVSKICILGDFFDNRNEIGVQTLHVASQFMDILNDFDITIIAGNHDMFYKNRNDVHSIGIFSGRKNVRIIDDITTETIGTTTATYIPWGCDMSGIQKSDIIFGHLELNGFYMMLGKAAEGKVDPQNLLDKADLIFSGHFHLRDERKFAQNKKIIYIGSPYQLNWGEVSNIPGFYVLDFDDKSYQFFENDISPRHIKMNSSNIDSEVIKNNIISIEFNDETEEEQLKIRTTVFASSPMETKFIGQTQILSVDSDKISYDANINLLDMMFKFTDELNVGEYTEDIKQKLKGLYEKYAN